MKTSMEYVEEYLEFKSIQFPVAAKNYRIWLERFVEFIEYKCVNDLKQTDFTGFYRYWETKVRAATLALGMHGIRDFIKYCFKHRYTQFDFDYVPLVKKGVFGHHESLSYEEVQKMIDVLMLEDTIHNLRDATIISFLFDTFCRVSELTSLDEANLVTTDNIWWGKVKVLKKRKDDIWRVFYLTPRTRFLLEKYLEKKRIISNNPALFISLDRSDTFLGRITSRSVERLVKRATKLAGIQRNIVVHSFRRGGAIDLIKNGGTNADVQNFLGHSSLESTRPYTVYNRVEMKDRFLQLKNKGKKPQTVEDVIASGIEKSS